LVNQSLLLRRLVPTEPACRLAAPTRRAVLRVPLRDGRAMPLRVRLLRILSDTYVCQTTKDEEGSPLEVGATAWAIPARGRGSRARTRRGSFRPGGGAGPAAPTQPARARPAVLPVLRPAGGEAAAHHDEG
jgi:hypothetical protein